MINHHNIQKRVTLITIVPLLIMTFCLELFLLYGRFADIDRGLLERGTLIARQLATSSEYGVFSNNKTFLNSLAGGVLREPDVRGLVILNASAEVLVQAGDFSITMQELSGDARAAAAENGSPLARASLTNPPVTSTDAVRIGDDNIWIYQAIVPTQVALDEFATAVPPQKIGAVMVEVSKANTEHLKHKLLWVTLGSTALFLLLAMYLVHVASRGITAPIRRLSGAVQQIAQGDLDTRVILSTKISELTTLSRGLNDMAEQLQHDREVLQQRIEQATLELREKKEEAEFANHNKSRFLAVASHDLRQPLHALGLYVAELRRQLSVTPQQHLIEQVDQSVNALTNLLNVLLDISKLDAGAVIPQLQACNIAALIGRIAGDFQMLAATKNISLLVHPCAAYVMSDPMLLERVLVNLVSNAIRYSYPNGRVMIACRMRGGQLCIEVRDNGIGISPENQASIFREFVQVSRSQLDSGKGLGLGLAIVDRLVKLLGHRITLRSLENKGSVFTVHVPLIPNSGKAADANLALFASSAITDGSLPLKGKNVLIVDDDELVLSSTLTILQSWGAGIYIAKSLFEVHRLLLNEMHFDLLLVDYQLGGDETGFDVITAVNSHQQSDVPTILISGNSDTELLKLASLAGHQLLYKPVRPAKLRSLVMYLIGSSGAR